MSSTLVTAQLEMELDVHASDTCSNAGRSAEGGGREPTLAITLSQYFPGLFFLCYLPPKKTF